MFKIIMEEFIMFHFDALMISIAVTILIFVAVYKIEENRKYTVKDLISDIKSFSIITLGLWLIISLISEALVLAQIGTVAFFK